jgi:hypothetical protein
MTKQGKYNLSGVWADAVYKVMDSLGGDGYAYYDFDITDIKDPEVSKKGKIYFGIKVFTTKVGRKQAAKHITGNIQSLFSNTEIEKENTQIDIPVTSGNFTKYIRVLVKPGAGAGSGGGAEETKRNECAQCVYASLAFNVYKGEIDPTIAISREHWEEAAKYIKIDAKVEDCYGDALDTEWHFSSIKGANKLWQTFGGSTKRYIFCRGGGPDDKEIKKAYQRARNSMQKDPNNKVIFSSEDKWNPADIWMVSTTFNASDLDQYKTVDTINQFIKEKYEDRELIGVSLKKMKGPAKLKVLNYDPNDKMKELDEVSFAGYWVRYKDGKKKNIEDAYPMDVYLYWKVGGPLSNAQRFQSRNFAGGTKGSWQIELKGISAAQGRCGGGSIIEILKSLGVSYSGITSGWENSSFWAACNPKNKSKKDAITDELILLLNKYCAGNHQAEYPGDTQARLELGNRTQSYRYSKLMGLRLLDCMKTSGNGDEIMKALYSYAGSQTDKSSVHVKLMD